MARSSHHRGARPRPATGQGTDRRQAGRVPADQEPAEPAPAFPAPLEGVPADPAPAEPEPAEREVWCDTCEVMVPIGDLDEDDCCPTCGEPVGPRRVPWKFRLMIGATVIYLGYRAYQGIEWVAHHL